MNRADTKVPAGFGVAAVRAVSSGADDVCICIVEMLLLDLIGKGGTPHAIYRAARGIKVYIGLKFFFARWFLTAAHNILVIFVNNM